MIFMAPPSPGHRLDDLGDHTDDIRDLLNAGADKVSINTAAVEAPNFVKRAADRFGSQCIVVAIDAKQRDGIEGWEVYTYGGRRPTGLDACQWAKQVEELGAGEILLTSMDCDGTKDGYDIELTRRISESVNIPVIASGGAGNLEHLYEALAELADILIKDDALRQQIIARQQQRAQAFMEANVMQIWRAFLAEMDDLPPTDAGFGT